MSRLLRSLLTAVVLVPLLLCACDGPVTPEDAGESRDGGADADMMVCERDSDCGDQSLFCADWRCWPGDPGADSRGCIDIGPPCDGGACDEEADSCSAPSWCTEGRDGCLGAGDCDGDGAPALECGGNDCDDDDPSRYPGNPELCDAEGHDEDCDPTTVGNTDTDSDTFVSSACCNAQRDGTLRCGDDCADGDVNRNPSAAETCNGLDDDCDGVPDGGGGLCPGGSCVGGLCDFDAWDRTFGGSSADRATSVAVDASGAVILAGRITDRADFGGGPRTVTGGGPAVFVAKYAADGTFDWAYLSPGATFLNDPHIAVSPSGDNIYVVGSGTGIDFGSGVPDGAYLVRLAGDGTLRGDARFGSTGTHFAGIAADDTGVVVGGTFSGSVDFGGGPRAAQGSASLILARFDSSGARVWDVPFHAGGTSTSRRASAVGVAIHAATGELWVAGNYANGPITVGTDSLPTAPGLGFSFVARMSSTGAPMTARALTSSTGWLRIEWLASAPSGRAYAVGRFTQSLVPGGTCMTHLSTGAECTTDTRQNAFVAAFDATGEPDWARAFGGTGGDDTAFGVAVDAVESVLVVGDFATATNFGGGTQSAPLARDGFLARYTAAGVHQRDFRYASGGETSVRGVAIGPGNSTVIVGRFAGEADFGTGPRTSEGLDDAFVLRLGS